MYKHNIIMFFCFFFPFESANMESEPDDESGDNENDDEEFESVNKNSTDDECSTRLSNLLNLNVNNQVDLKKNKILELDWNQTNNFFIGLENKIN